MNYRILFFGLLEFFIIKKNTHFFEHYLMFLSFTFPGMNIGQIVYEK